jgi:hypothetical protein
MTFKDGYKQLTELHLKNQNIAIEGILEHTEKDGEVFKSVRDFLLKRAQIEQDYALALEGLVKNFRIKASKGGLIKPNNALSLKALKSNLLPSLDDPAVNQILTGGTEEESFRPVDLATNFLLQESENQAKSRLILSARLSQKITSMLGDWEKCYKFRICQANISFSLYYFINSYFL